MTGLKRMSNQIGPSGQRRGAVLGHQCGCQADSMLDYLQARIRIYLPCYLEILLRVPNELDQLKSFAQEDGLVLLDYNTNEDVRNLSSPLSHAALIRDYLNDCWFCVA